MAETEATFWGGCSKLESKDNASFITLRMIFTMIDKLVLSTFTSKTLLHF